jgi:hypothetical protein
MTAVVGQAGGRLRVYRLSVPGARSGAMRPVPPLNPLDDSRPA